MCLTSASVWASSLLTLIWAWLARGWLQEAERQIEGDVRNAARALGVLAGKAGIGAATVSFLGSLAAFWDDKLGKAITALGALLFVFTAVLVLLAAQF